MKVSTDGQVRINFTPPGEVTSDLLEKLAFPPAPPSGRWRPAAPPCGK